MRSGICAAPGSSPAATVDRAVRFYASGYYYDAKRKGLLDETGLGVDRRRRMAPTI